jgi:hypothetical protein
MKTHFSYVWNDNHSIEGFLDGIIENPDDLHIYQGTPEYEPGVEYYTSPETYTEKYHKVRAMTDSDPLLTDRVIYVTGSHSDWHDIIPGQTVSWWHWPWQYYMNMYSLYNCDVMTHLRSEPTKLFCCLNHRPKPHRIKAVSALCDLGLLTSGDVTFCNSHSAWNTFITDDIQSSDSDRSDLALQVIKHVRQFAQCEFSNADLLVKNQAVIPDYEKYLFDIVTECTSDTIFYSEKTLRPIFWGKPFVILAHPKQNSVLSDMGYETFPEYFDLSDESDYLKVCEPLTGLTDSDLRAIKATTMPKVEHNHSVFVKQMFDDDLIPDLMSDHNSDVMATDVSLESITKSREWLSHNSYFSQYV